MIDTDPTLHRTAAGVMVVEALVILALWLVGRYFGA
jgi:hypothetical protein